MENSFIASSHLFPDGFFMQKHKPLIMDSTHNHNHVEVIFPDGCSLEYHTHVGVKTAPDGHLCLLWGQLPHRVTSIIGEGLVYIANVPLQEILSLGLNEAITEPLLSGQLIVADNHYPSDRHSFERWIADYHSKHPGVMELARTELQCRLRRQTLDGWQEEPHQTKAVFSKSTSRQMKRVHDMIRFMAEHYTQSITIKDIAMASGVSEGYAMGLFQKALSMSMTNYLTKLRLYHAKSALVESNEKILNIALDSGFGSLSRFYEVFGQDTGTTPQSFRQAARL